MAVESEHPVRVQLGLFPGMPDLVIREEEPHPDVSSDGSSNGSSKPSDAPDEPEADPDPAPVDDGQLVRHLRRRG